MIFVARIAQTKRLDLLSSSRSQFDNLGANFRLNSAVGNTLSRAMESGDGCAPGLYYYGSRGM